MRTGFGLTLIVYTLGVGLICGACAVLGRGRPRPVLAALVLIELGVVVQAGIDLTLVLRGRHGGELATHIGYLITSLVILPVTVGAVRLDPGRWGNAALAVGCVMAAVVSLRLHQTLGTPRA